MKSIIFIILGALLMPLCASAQEYHRDYKKVRRLEFEVGFGLNKGNAFNGARAEPAGQFFLETRLNDLPGLSVGAQFMRGAFFRYGDRYGHNHTLRFSAMTTFADFNLRKWKNITPFASLGLGFAFVDDEYSNPNSDNYLTRSGTYSARSVNFNPRVGVEFFNHIRLTMEYKMMSYEYACWCMNLGVVFGGGYKR